MEHIHHMFLYTPMETYNILILEHILYGTHIFINIHHMFLYSCDMKHRWSLAWHLVQIVHSLPVCYMQAFDSLFKFFSTDVRECCSGT